MSAEFDLKRSFTIREVQLYKQDEIAIYPFDYPHTPLKMPISEVKVVMTKEVWYLGKPKFDPVGKTLAFGSRRHKAGWFKMWGIIGTSHGLKKSQNPPEPFNFMLEACKLLARG